LEVLEEGSFISLAWQLPQIIAMTTAEVMFSITSLEFAFTQVKFIFKDIILWFLKLYYFTGTFEYEVFIGSC
jgi:hypothetical protein